MRPRNASVKEGGVHILRRELLTPVVRIFKLGSDAEFARQAEEEIIVLDLFISSLYLCSITLAACVAVTIAVVTMIPSVSFKYLMMRVAILTTCLVRIFRFQQYL